MSLEQQERQNQARIRAVYDITKGLLWTVLGAFLLLYRQLGFDFEFDRGLVTIFAICCVGYGLFRGWRGVKNKMV
jgi:hypothetical protein